MSSAFKDGVDAGLSDFMSFYSDLTGTSLDPDPANFGKFADICGKVPDFVSRMQPGFSRIGENLTGDAQSWAGQQKQVLLTCCDNMLQVAAALAPLATTAQQAAQTVQDLGDPGDDEDKKSQVSAATDSMNSAISAASDQVERAKGTFTDFHDSLREVNEAFKAQIAQAKRTVDSSQGPVDLAVNNMRNLETQILSKRDDLKSALAQVNSQYAAHGDMSSKIDDKINAEKAADQAVLDGAKKDPPLSASDLQSLEQAAASARQDRERAEADREAFYNNSVLPAMKAHGTRSEEMHALTSQWSAMKQARDSTVNVLNAARTVLAQFNLEYQEPSL